MRAAVRLSSFFLRAEFTLPIFVAAEKNGFACRPPRPRGCSDS